MRGAEKYGTGNRCMYRAVIGRVELCYNKGLS
jgi:hypothetical protein